MGALRGALPAPYSAYFGKDGKPELYAAESVDGTALAAVVQRPGLQGTSFAALHAVAAAILVWATDRELSARDVRSVLLETAEPLDTTDGEVRRIDVNAALSRIRAQLLLDTLERGPFKLGELLAETGMRPELAVPLLNQLIERGELRKVVHAGSERYENPNALYLAYARLRREPSGRGRTVELDRLVARARVLAQRRQFTADDVQMLWTSGEDGRRIVALAIVQTWPEFGTVLMLSNGIAEPRTPFEQFHALRAAEKLLDQLDDEGREQLREAIKQAQLPDRAVQLKGDRQQLIRRLLVRLTPTTETDKREPSPSSWSRSQ